MFKSVGRLTLIVTAFFSKSAFAADIIINSSTVTTTQTLSEISQILSISDTGNLNVSGALAVNGSSSGSDLAITVNTDDSELGITASGSSNSAIQINGSLATLNLQKGVITSESQTNGTISLLSNIESTPTITISSGGTISNTNTQGFAIFSNSLSNTSLTINNSGEIISNNDSDSGAIKFEDDNGGSTIIVNNTSGVINAGASGKAIDLIGSGNSATINNSGTGSIIGSITADTGDLDIINTGDLDNVDNTDDKITGNINLGTNAGSSLVINNGSVDGDVTLGNSAQTVTFSGTGILTGTIDGPGTISVTDSTAVNGNIGATTSLTSITVAAGQTFTASESSSSIRATNISLGSNSTLRMGTGALSGTVDGAAANQGRVAFSWGGSGITINSTLGSTNGLATINFNTTSAATATLAQNARAQTVNIMGTSATLNVGSNVSITGNVVISTGNTLILNNTSSISGDIKGSTNGVGTVSIANGAAVNGLGDFGTSSLKLAALSLVSNSTLTMASGKVINATAINVGASATLDAFSNITGTTTLGSAANLNLKDASSFTGTINGSADNQGKVNTQGLAIILAPIGTSHAVSEINVASGSQARIGNSNSSHANIIKANSINVTGQLDLLDATTITGNLSLLGPASKVNTSGYSQTINGNFTTTGGSTIMTTVHSTSSADLITVAGIATLDANTKLSVTVAGGATAAGSTYTILSGDSGSSISAISDSNINVNDSGTNKSGSLVFRTSISGNNLILSVASEIIDPVIITPALSNPASKAIYNAIGSSPTGNLLAFKNYVESVGEAEAEAAVKSASPQTDNSNNRTAMSIASASTSTAEIRMAELSGNAPVVTAAAVEKNLRKKLGLTATDVPVCEEKETIEHGMWMKAFGSSAIQSNGATGGQGFNSNSGGFAIGADNKIDELTVLGVNFSIANSRIKSSDSLKKTDVDTYQLNFYGGRNIGKYYVNAIVGAAQSEYSSTRAIPSVSQTASANYSGQTYVALVKGGRSFVVTPKINFIPEITITAMRNKVDNYTEQGAGNLDLSIQNKPANFFENRLGAILDYTTFTANKTKVRPALKVSYGYDWIGAQQSTTANFIDQASSFTAQGTKVDKRSIKMGAGIDIYRLDNITLSAEYTYEYKYIYHANSASAMMRYNF